MKNLLAFAGLCLLLSCSKQVDKVDTPQPGLTERDNFIMPTPNTVVFRHSNTTVHTTTTTTTITGATYLVYLDFDGEVVNSPYWNGGNTLNCAASGLTQAQDSEVIDEARELYSRYNVIFTSDVNDYNNYNVAARQKIIITTTSTWMPGVSGVSQIGSISWGNNTPSFVFSNLLSFNSTYVGEIVAHELGHTCGLYHQMEYNSSCGQVGYHQAVIMGYPFVAAPTWINGTTTTCSTYQDDDAILTAKLGLK